MEINMKSIYIILGNSFTLDFLQNIEKSDIIDAVNFFKNGEKLLCPENNNTTLLY